MTDNVIRWDLVLCKEYILRYTLYTNEKIRGLHLVSFGAVVAEPANSHLVNCNTYPHSEAICF